MPLVHRCTEDIMRDSFGYVLQSFLGYRHEHIPNQSNHEALRRFARETYAYATDLLFDCFGNVLRLVLRYRQCAYSQPVKPCSTQAYCLENYTEDIVLNWFGNVLRAALRYEQSVQPHSPFYV